MGFKSLWIEVKSRKVFNLYLSDRTIYRATEENINSDRDPMDLLGNVVAPISADIIRRMFVVYLNESGSVRIAPIRESHMEFIMENRGIFKNPLNIKTLYDIIDL